MPAGAVVESNNTVSGVFGPLRNPGAPVSGTNSVQTITLGGTPTGGSFTLSAYGFVTAAIAWSATNATLVANIKAALEALPPIGSSNTTVAVGTMTAGIGTITVTFDQGPLAHTAVPAMSVGVNSLTGTSPTVAVANTTPGVAATHRNQAVGALLIDTTNAIIYTNTGTLGAPTWTKVGTQT